MKRRQNKPRQSSNVQAAAWGAAVSAVVLLAVCGLGAMALHWEWLPESALPVFGPLAVGLAAFCGPLPLIHQVGKRPLPMAYCYMLGILLALLLVRTIFWSDSAFSNWTVPACAVAGATAAGFLGGRRKGRRR